MPNLADIYQSLTQSGCRWCLNLGTTTTATTAATATTGFFSFQLIGNSIGSTWPNTLQSLSANGSPLVSLQSTNTVGRGGTIALIYKIGTLNFSTVGNGFTHDTATFPLLRDELNTLNQPQAYLPFLKITTAITGTAPIIRLQTSAGGAGFVDQDGANVIGTTSITVPISVIGSCYFLPLNNATATQDIIQIRIDTAATTGVAEVYMYEEIAINQTIVAGAGVYDVIGGSGLNITTTVPAIATTGSVVSSLVYVNFSNAAVTQSIIELEG
jgi:hypothetical protein